MAELAGLKGYCHRSASNIVRGWADRGLVRYVGKRRVVNISGGSNQVPVYAPVRRG